MLKFEAAKINKYLSQIIPKILFIRNLGFVEILFFMLLFGKIIQGKYL